MYNTCKGRIKRFKKQKPTIPHINTKTKPIDSKTLQKGDTLSFENFQTHMKKLYPPSKKDLEAKANA